MPKMSTVAFLYPGAMGASLARTLHLRQPHLTLLTSIGSRSAASYQRAKEAGLIDVPLPELVQRADIIISILPPSAAVELAQTVSDLVSSHDKLKTNRTVYIDANAISPGTVGEISKILSQAGVTFIDGCVIGLPAREGFDPKVYLSTDSQHEEIMKEVSQVLGGQGEKTGLRMIAMEGAGEGAASALKMCYGGINKGLIGLMASMILTANAHSPATADALLQELSDSRPTMLGEQCRFLPDMVGKAYRFVGEMEEISSFIDVSLPPSTSSSLTTTGKTVSDTFQGLAQMFQRIADSQKQEEEAGQGTVVKTILDWAEQGKSVLMGKEAK